MNRLIGVCLTAWLSGVAARAEANIAAPSDRTAKVSGLTTLETGGLNVTAEELAIDCRSHWGRPRCRFSARYEFTNPGTAPARVTPAFLGLDTDVSSVRVDGRAVELSASDADHGMTATRFVLAVEPGARAVVEIMGEIRPAGRTSPSYAADAAAGRHPFLGTPRRPEWYTISYLVYPIRTWGPAPMIRVRLTHPESWEVAARIDTGEGPARRSTAGGTVTHDMTIDGNVANELGLSIGVPPQQFFHGGPVLGIGGATGPGGGFRLRVGWEVAFPAQLLHAVSVDTDFHDRVVLTPMVKLATPVVLIIPSLGAGVGLPVMLKPHRTAGIRVELDLQWPLLGFAMSFDVYPELWDDRPDRFEAAFLARFSL